MLQYNKCDNPKVSSVCSQGVQRTRILYLIYLHCMLQKQNDFLCGKKNPKKPKKNPNPPKKTKTKKQKHQKKNNNKKKTAMTGN